MRKSVVSWVLGVLVLLASASAWADHWRGRVGIVVSPWPVLAAPLYYPHYYYPPPIMVQQPVVVQQPQTYVERTVETSAPAGYWYYCPSSRAYYPYVKECQDGWQRVSPQPQQ